MFVKFLMLLLSVNTFGFSLGKNADQFEQECLKRINAYRARHGAKSLTLDKELHITAENRALIIEGEDLTLEEQIKEYIDKPNIGENAEYLKESANALDAIDKWYAQRKTLKPGSTGSKQNKHFSQMVWKASTSLGCVQKKKKNGPGVYIVAHFRPKGNDQNTFAQNVQIEETVLNSAAGSNSNAQKKPNSNKPSARGMGFQKNKNEDAQDSNGTSVVQTTLLSLFIVVSFIAII